jgi:hypothetical protein
MNVFLTVTSPGANANCSASRAPGGIERLASHVLSASANCSASRAPGGIERLASHVLSLSSKLLSTSALLSPTLAQPKPVL